MKIADLFAVQREKPFQIGIENGVAQKHDVFFGHAGKQLVERANSGCPYVISLCIKFSINTKPLGHSNQAQAVVAHCIASENIRSTYPQRHFPLVFAMSANRCAYARATASTE